MIIFYQHAPLDYAIQWFFPLFLFYFFHFFFCTFLTFLLYGGTVTSLEYFSFVNRYFFFCGLVLNLFSPLFFIHLYFNGRCISFVDFIIYNPSSFVNTFFKISFSFFISLLFIFYFPIILHFSTFFPSIFHYAPFTDSKQSPNVCKQTL